MTGETWGIEPAETAIAFPCDQIPGGFDADYYRGVTVHAPSAVVFRWLCQLRAAPYSYDWIDNWGRQSPRHLIPGLEELEIGQTVMTIFKLTDFEKDRHLTCRIKPGSPSSRLFGDVVVSYLIVPRSDRECRLLAKVRVGYPRGAMGWLMRAVLPPGDLVMMRRQLLNLKQRAEST
ncbi:MAG TPA: hypothetical protein VIA62_01775 [Thermoanaerobaculia bacterium]|jgi:hypothetical protein|nr:hypothetical protein [Thermoanaerobaculia bacterium]